MSASVPTSMPASMTTYDDISVETFASWWTWFNDLDPLLYDILIMWFLLGIASLIEVAWQKSESVRHGFMQGFDDSCNMHMCTSSKPIQDPPRDVPQNVSEDVSEDVPEELPETPTKYVGEPIVIKPRSITTKTIDERKNST